MEVKDVLENYTNLEKECESAKQPVSIELQVYLYSFFTIHFHRQNMLLILTFYFIFFCSIGEAEEAARGLAFRKIWRKF